MFPRQMTMDIAVLTVFSSLFPVCHRAVNVSMLTITVDVCKIRNKLLCNAIFRYKLLLRVSVSIL